MAATTNFTNKDAENDNEECHYVTSRPASIEVLPDELLELLMTYVRPYGDLFVCQLVCKRWRDVVQNLVRRCKQGFSRGLQDFRLRWVELDDELPTFRQPPREQVIAGRFAHSAIRLGNFMYIFGGGSTSNTTYNDWWRFSLSELKWQRMPSKGNYPSPKGSATLVNWRDQLVLFGGWRYPSLFPMFQLANLFDELHYYSLETHHWVWHSPSQSPPARGGHSATVHGDNMVVFGGYQLTGERHESSNDTWVLDLEKRRWWQPMLTGNARPSPRSGQIQVALDDQHLLVVGGCGGPNRVYSDAWVLDMTRPDVWTWRPIAVRNKKFSAAQSWCSPACKVNNYLVVLGPTSNAPLDFQLIRHGGNPGATPAPDAAPNRNNELQQPARRHELNAPVRGRLRPGNALAVLGNGNHVVNSRAWNDVAVANDRRAVNQQVHNNYNNNNIRNLNMQPQSGELNNLHGSRSDSEERNLNRPSGSPASSSRPNEDDAANRLQRNLALRCRDNEPLLPKRFNEVHEDPIRMAAFNVPIRSRSASRDHSERIRRMEEKINAIRNQRRGEISPQRPTMRELSPKRVRRNVQALHVCDISRASDAVEPYIEWLEYKNRAAIQGAPERFIFSSLVPGNGELVLFGGVQKETLSGSEHIVSNAVHFLSAPREIF